SGIERWPRSRPPRRRRWTHDGDPQTIDRRSAGRAGVSRVLGKHGPLVAQRASHRRLAAEGLYRRTPGERALVRALRGRQPVRLGRGVDVGSATARRPAWQLNSEFKYDPSLVTEVEVSFTALGPRRTQVDFEHRNLERLGAA